MLEVKIDKIATSPTSLRLGCVIRYGKAGPVRFAVALLDDEVLTLETIAEVQTWLSRQSARIIEAERRALDQGSDPLF